MVKHFSNVRQKAIAVLLSVAVLAVITTAVAVAVPAQAQAQAEEAGKWPQDTGAPSQEDLGRAYEELTHPHGPAPVFSDGRTGNLEDIPGFSELTHPHGPVPVSEVERASSTEEAAPAGVSERGSAAPAEKAVPGLASPRKDRSAPASPGGRVGPAQKVPGFKNLSNPAVSGNKVAESFKAYNHEDPFGINEYLVPRDLDNAFGLSFGSGTDSVDFSITRRGSETAAEAVEIGEGVYYDDPDKQVITYTQQFENIGRNVIVEILASPEAPSVYEYALDLPEGHSLSINADGGADILDADGVPTDVSVDAPWAFDSAGVAVPVSYSVGEGNVLEFTVDHTSGNYAYPIAADPAFLIAPVAILVVRAAPVVIRAATTAYRASRAARGAACPALSAGWGASAYSVTRASGGDHTDASISGASTTALGASRCR